jgi:hypothetical protein
MSVRRHLNGDARAVSARLNAETASEDGKTLPNAVQTATSAYSGGWALVVSPKALSVVCDLDLQITGAGSDQDSTPVGSRVLHEVVDELPRALVEDHCRLYRRLRDLGGLEMGNCNAAARRDVSGEGLEGLGQPAEIEGRGAQLELQAP